MFHSNRPCTVNKLTDKVWSLLHRPFELRMLAIKNSISRHKENESGDSLGSRGKV